MSMNYTTLKENADFFQQTLQLIEESFNYSSENSFEIDFYPLMEKNNHNNCHLLIKDKEVIGHIGVLEKEITIKEESFSIIMLGGIAIASKHRGQGLFTPFFEHVLNLYKEKSFYMLWSDQIELYEKFDFYPCVDQFEYDQSLEDAEEFIPTKLNTLHSNDIEALSAIYNSQTDIRITRSLQDWDTLKKITSTDLYIKKENNIIKNYFFMNKGEDLSEVLVEVGSFDDFEELKKYGVLWSSEKLEEECDSLYATLIKISNPSSFKSFIRAFTNNLIQIEKISKDNITFNFESSIMELETNEFLTGVFGPNKFEELQDLKPFYISGLDSI